MTGWQETHVGGVCYRLDDVMYDAEAAQQLEATVAEEKAQVQLCKEKVDDLASHLAGMHLQTCGPCHVITFDGSTVQRVSCIEALYNPTKHHLCACAFSRHRTSCCYSKLTYSHVTSSAVCLPKQNLMRRAV